ncbi:MAG TPA: DUF3141 domain-containing protein [Thermodesulfobacteriota bacterium]|nr:DUF3141 domain-containing protein [Thermodesulfobacteriota bacterium]
MEDKKPVNPFSFYSDFMKSTWDYLIDSYQRSVLFWDVMRKRGNTFLEHYEKGKPPVLRFKYEILLDGRDLERPCNYVLLRIPPEKGVKIDPKKRPFVVVDPRAGHGPGIGGFKYDSQVGVAMRAGHPVYFISFFPDPVPGQTLGDIGYAEVLFIEEVAKRHPNSEGKPCVVGNCQAGWAVAALAALRPDVVGLIILNGAPLSYWAGEDNKNPMRYLGGFLGGSWMTSLACDLGNGLFDGAHIVTNFERLNPANTYWSKQYNLYANIDTEEPRYLDFEKWWGGYFLMTEDEIEHIVNDLFIGNKLGKGAIESKSGAHVDLKNIQSPVVIFASHADDITPPQQALNWIVDVYGHEDAIVENGHVIVYLLHEDIGHLGIFVSGRVAKKEHTELVNVMEMIDRLPPGLYEMVIERKPDAHRYGELEEGEYTVRFETRKVKDILALDESREDEALFSTIDQVSKINNLLYKTFISPYVKAMSTETSATFLKLLHPLRMQHYLFSDLNPFMASIATMANWVRSKRKPMPNDNRFLALEKEISQCIEETLNAYRDIRDNSTRNFVSALYGPFGLGAIFPPEQPEKIETKEGIKTQLEAKKAQMENRFEEGGFVEAVVRMLIAGIKKKGAAERRSFLIAEKLRKQNGDLRWPTRSEFKKLVREQTLILSMDPERAIQALPKLLPTKEERIKAVALVGKILMVEPELADPKSQLAKRVKEILGVELTFPKGA